MGKSVVIKGHWVSICSRLRTHWRMCQAPQVLTWGRLSLWLWKNGPAARKEEELLPALETGKPSCGVLQVSVTGESIKGGKGKSYNRVPSSSWKKWTRATWVSTDGSIPEHSHLTSPCCVASLGGPQTLQQATPALSPGLSHTSLLLTPYPVNTAIPYSISWILGGPES